MSRDTSGVGKGYSLWLMPGEPMFSRLAEEIAKLSQELATPLFEPHVTLLGGIMLPGEEVLGRSASLAGSLKPFRIELGNIGYLDEYFRCLFVRVVSTDPILKAHQTAREAIGQHDELPYMPHLSLIYGMLGIEMKKKIVAGLGSLAGQAFEVNSLVVYRVSGSPTGWNFAKRFEFQ